MNSQKPMGQNSALEKLLKLFFHKTGDSLFIVPVHLLVEVQKVFLDEFVKKSFFRLMSFVTDRGVGEMRIE